MAERLSNGGADERGVNKEHNVEARKDAIRDALQETLNLDRQIAVLMEKHIAPLRANKRDIKARLRNDFNITAKQFNARYQLLKIERDAQDSDDEITLDVIRELYEVAPVGGVVDLVTAAEEAAKRETASA